jgi:hypothetical protein
MRLYYFVDTPEGRDEFYGHVSGGRAGFKPVMTALYSKSDNDTEEEAEREVQFTCMKTFERDSDARHDPFASGADVGAGCIIRAANRPVVRGSFYLLRC